MQKINPEEYQKRLDRITDIFSDMARHADKQSQERCPYKNRFNQCTAQFGCRNQRKAPEEGALMMCVGDDKLDYRPAWDTEAKSTDPEESEASGSNQASK